MHEGTADGSKQEARSEPKADQINPQDDGWVTRQPSDGEKPKLFLLKVRKNVKKKKEVQVLF